jgi:uncharacterized DUF497 family protein
MAPKSEHLVSRIKCLYINPPLRVEWDEAKNAANQAKHGLDFADFVEFDEVAIIKPDSRFDYGEPRLRAFGRIGGLPHMIVFTAQAGVMRLISFRRAHEKEIRRHE